MAANKNNPKFVLYCRDLMDVLTLGAAETLLGQAASGIGAASQLLALQSSRGPTPDPESLVALNLSPSCPRTPAPQHYTSGGPRSARQPRWES